MGKFQHRMTCKKVQHAMGGSRNDRVSRLHYAAHARAGTDPCSWGLCRQCHWYPPQDKDWQPWVQLEHEDGGHGSKPTQSELSARTTTWTKCGVARCYANLLRASQDVLPSRVSIFCSTFSPPTLALQ
eukprot:329453-Amphidinium_carterae.1